MSNKLRRHARHEFTAKAWLTWDAGGSAKQVACVGVDISSSGMRLSSPEPLPAGTPVNFRIQGTLFAGAGLIRSCVHVKMRFLLGVEFVQGVRWNPERYPLGRAVARPAAQTAAEEPKTDDASLAVEQ